MALAIWITKAKPEVFGKIPKKTLYGAGYFSVKNNI